MPRRGKTKRFPAWDPAGQGCIKLWIGPRIVPVRSDHEGKKAPEGPIPKPIPTRCEPGRFAVRNIEHRTSNIQHPISKGGAKPPKATPKPPQSQLLGNQLGTQSHPKATLKPHQSHTKATPKPPSRVAVIAGMVAETLTHTLFAGHVNDSMMLLSISDGLRRARAYRG
jgi:hypothetical protein